MAIAEKKYKVDDLKINMRVKVSQLSDIMDTCMLLVDSVMLDDKDVEGTLVYFGPGETEEYTKWFMQSEKGITPVYFDSEEILEGVTYDE
ncbi:MAG: hypothetical protein K6B14_07755 [Lachnospiraceae bacterium]|nr:hypothetical protein [Lachnospiraceae bacterium]